MFYSQDWIAQDKFVVETLRNKKNGIFLDIGCHHYQDISNTYFLEKELNWSGIGIDIDCSYQDDWNSFRKHSLFVCGDATNLNYNELLLQQNMPKIIDYLTIDLEPPQLSLKALEKILETDYLFRVVTFETDAYRQLETRDISRKLFKEKGYTFIEERNAQDDFYVFTSLLEN